MNLLKRLMYSMRFYPVVGLFTMSWRFRVSLPSLIVIARLFTIIIHPLCKPLSRRMTCDDFRHRRNCLISIWQKKKYWHNFPSNYTKYQKLCWWPTEYDKESLAIHPSRWHWYEPISTRTTNAFVFKWPLQNICFCEYQTDINYSRRWENGITRFCFN